VQAIAAPGHTVGHTIFIIKSERKTLAFTGDTTHHQILLTETPRTEFVYDTDPKQAVASRLKVLDRRRCRCTPRNSGHQFFFDQRGEVCLGFDLKLLRGGDCNKWIRSLIRPAQPDSAQSLEQRL
jgi:hypothetical protein